MSAEIYLISRMEKDGRITSQQADELVQIASENEFACHAGKCGSYTKVIYN